MTVDTKQLVASDSQHVIHPLSSPREMATSGPRIVTEGDGWWITDGEGRRLIDGFAGLWCVAVGHGRREIVEAVREQMQRLEYHTTFHGLSTPPAIELAARLASMFPPSHGLGRVMFASGGSEANENLFKLVRLYFSLLGEDRKKTIVGRHHGYHGLTIATMAATGIMPLHWNFGPEPAGFAHVPAPYCYRCEFDATYPDCGLACAKALDELIETEGPETVAAFVAEPVMGAGGIIPPPPDYFATVREICDRHGVLLIADEVVTGFGRTGTMFGFEHYGLRPDMVTLAKGLTSGYLPLGASVVADRIWEVVVERLPEQMPFSHGFTYMGHPVCCAAALANLSIIEEEDLPGNAARVGAHLMARMKELERYDSVGEIRGVGLMVGIELVADKETKRGFKNPHTACTMVEHEAWERGLYCRAMGTEVVGLAPPLTIDVETADRMVEILAQAIEAMEHEILAREPRGAAPARERIASPAEFFDRVVPERFDPAQAEGTDVVVQFALTGEGGGYWVMTIRDGTIDVSRPPQERADVTCTIRTSAADYLRILNGELAGDQAFMTKRLSLDGDLNAAMKLMELGFM